MPILLILAALSAANTWAHQATPPCEPLLQPSSVQRQIALGIEMAKMKAPGPSRGSVHTLNQHESIVRQSVINYQKLLTAVKQAFPIEQSLDKEAVEQIRRYISRMDFALLSVSANPDASSFFYNLLGGTRLSEFKVVAIPYGGPLTALYNRVNRDMLRIDTEFARENAIVLPHFSGPRSLIEFFASWNADSMDELIKYNRMNLPNNVRTSEQFQIHLLKTNDSELFPMERVRDRLGPLRQRLYGFAMTYEEAETFFREVTIHYLTYKVAKMELSMAGIDKTIRAAGGMDSLFADAMHWIGWEGAAVHVPLTIPASYFRVVRLIETQSMSIPDYSRQHQLHSPFGPPADK